jgi:hypothetical protein
LGNPALATGAGLNRIVGSVGRPGSKLGPAIGVASNHLDGSIIHRMVGNEKAEA